MKTKCMSCGGSMKKMQLGGLIKGVIKYGVKGGVKGANIGVRAAEKNKALTKQAKRLIDLNKRAPGTIGKMVKKESLKIVKDSESKKLNTLLNRVSNVERKRTFNKDLRKVLLGTGSMIGSLGAAAYYFDKKDKKKKKLK